MTSRLIPLRRLRLRRLDQVIAVAGNPDRVLNARDRHSRYKVVVDVDDLARQNDAIAYLGGVRGFRGSFSHAEYVEQHSKEAR